MSMHFFVFLLFFRAAGVAYLISQARGWNQSCSCYATATAMPDLSHICNLHSSSWQHQILNPLSGTKDPTCVLTDTSQLHYH